MVHSAPMVTPTGSFPVPVVRFFKEETYATQFAQEGRARFTCQESYHDSPDEARRDDTEGTGRLARGNLPLVRVNKTPLSAELEVITTNPVYVLCFSEASADLMTLKRQ